MTSNNRVVISLHGIQTRGVWQKDLVPSLALAGFIPYVLDYGNFSAFQLLREKNLERQVGWLVQQYEQIRNETGCLLPSVIAHSFGTLQVARLLEMHPKVVFDKIILSGSTIPCDYPWTRMLSQSRATWVVNDYGGLDVWPKVAARFVPHAGSSGSLGFSDIHRGLVQVYHQYHRHSDYFSRLNFCDNWIPTLRMEKRQIVDSLHGLMGILARELKVPLSTLRCFVLVKDSGTGCLKVEPGLHVGQVGPGEADLAISLKAVGIEAGPVVAFTEMREVRQDADDLAALAQSLGTGTPINPDIKWSISLPVPNGTQPDQAIGVLIIDGLQEPSENALANELLSNNNVYLVLSRLGVALHLAHHPTA